MGCSSSKPSLGEEKYAKPINPQAPMMETISNPTSAEKLSSAAIAAPPTKVMDETEKIAISSTTVDVSPPIPTPRSNKLGSGNKTEDNYMQNADKGTSHDYKELEMRVSILESVDRVKQDLADREIYSARFVKVPGDYYDRSMEERMKCLAPCESIEQMCKSIVFENKAWVPDADKPHMGPMDDTTNSKYYLLVVQYAAKFSAEKLKNTVWKMRPEGSRISKNKINFQLADNGEELTGFMHNAVCPFGLKTAIPVVMSTACTQVKPRYIYMGSGRVDLKLGISLDDFISSTKAIIADVTDMR